MKHYLFLFFLVIESLFVISEVNTNIIFSVPVQFLINKNDLNEYEKKSGFRVMKYFGILNPTKSPINLSDVDLNVFSQKDIFLNLAQLLVKTKDAASLKKIEKYEGIYDSESYKFLLNTLEQVPGGMDYFFKKGQNILTVRSVACVFLDDDKFAILNEVRWKDGESPKKSWTYLRKINNAYRLYVPEPDPNLSSILNFYRSSDDLFYKSINLLPTTIK